MLLLKCLNSCLNSGLCLFNYAIIAFVAVFFIVEVEDLKKISNSMSVLLSERQKQEKVSNYLTFISLPHHLHSVVHMNCEVDCFKDEIAVSRLNFNFDST